MGGIHDLMLPIGLHQVLADASESAGTAAPDRSHLLVDFIRRTYNRPLNRTNLDLDAALRPLLLAGDNGANGSSETRAETLPLPLPASTWIETVFGGRETPHTLFAAILRSRGASLFYYGLLSLDDETRAWLATEPRLIAEMSGRRAAAFVAAAPGLRIRESRMEFPGGDAAVPVWESLVGHRAADPEGFTRALLAKQDGRLAYFLGAMSQLTPGQLRVALRLDSPDTGARVGAGRQLLALFGRVVLDWRVDENVFWRPELDPALLVASLHRGSDGLPIVPGTRQFWTAVFADPKKGSPAPGGTASLALPGAEAVDFPWLCEQVFTGNREADRRRYQVVLFVARLEAQGARWLGPNAIVAARAAQSFPALVFSLERARLVDVGAFAAAARRAEKLSAIRDEARATRAVAQFQGALGLVTRAGSRGGIPPAAMASAISSLSTVEFTQPGDYEGRLVRWVTGWLSAHVRAAPALELDVPTAGHMERNALATLAGPAAAAPRFVDWEGTRYRLDFAAAEAYRIATILGEQPRPYLSSAAALVTLADALGRDAASGEKVREHADALDAVARDVGWEHTWLWEGTDVRRRYLDAATALQGAAAASDARAARDTGAALLALADDLLARGLLELAYAVALGQPDRLTITADEAARRHDFAPPVAGRPSLTWEFPTTGMSPGRGWYLAGSVLGLDVRLAHLALARVSSKPPPRKPALADEHRRVLIETVALVDTSSLADEDSATIVAAIRKGRARLAEARSTADALELGDEIRLGPVHRTLLAWVVTKDREQLHSALSPSELLWLGLEGAPVSRGVHAWGVAAWPRTGCMCLEVLDRQPWGSLAGRWHAGALSSGFPDLNLRLAELLDELRMPASLLAPVLAAATLELVDTVDARDADDRRALLDFVRDLRPARVEQYLALLTVGGPLVPVHEKEPR